MVAGDDRRGAVQPTITDSAACSGYVEAGAIRPPLIALKILCLKYHKAAPIAASKTSMTTTAAISELDCVIVVVTVVSVVTVVVVSDVLVPVLPVL
jgi:hypothetical protein